MILSTKYGLVPPERELAPYEQPLKGMSPAERATWDRTVRSQIDDAFLDPGSRAAFEVLWNASTYNQELCEPFASNSRDAVFPLTRAWTPSEEQDFRASSLFVSM
jgi:hypothetical protein